MKLRNRSAQDIGLKKDFKRGSDFSSRGSRPEAFTDVSRGREVIVRREPLPTQTPTIDPRQVKDRYVFFLGIFNYLYIYFS